MIKYLKKLYNKIFSKKVTPNPGFGGYTYEARYIYTDEKGNQRNVDADSPSISVTIPTEHNESPDPKPKKKSKKRKKTKKSK